MQLAESTNFLTYRYLELGYFDILTENLAGEAVRVAIYPRNDSYLFGLYADRLNANPLMRAFYHSSEWLLKIEEKKNPNGDYAIERLKSGNGLGRDQAQTGFHSLQNKLGCECPACRSLLEWDQRHDEAVCPGCGHVDDNLSHVLDSPISQPDLVLNEEIYTRDGYQKNGNPGYGDDFAARYSPIAVHYDELPNYGHLSDNELDKMVGWKNRLRIREINNPEGEKKKGKNQRKPEPISSDDWKNWKKAAKMPGSPERRQAIMEYLGYKAWEITASTTPDQEPYEKWKKVMQDITRLYSLSV